MAEMLLDRSGANSTYSGTSDSSVSSGLFAEPSAVLLPAAGSTISSEYDLSSPLGAEGASQSVVHPESSAATAESGDSRAMAERVREGLLHRARENLNFAMDRQRFVSSVLELVRTDNQALLPTDMPYVGSGLRNPSLPAIRRPTHGLAKETVEFDRFELLTTGRVQRLKEARKKAEDPNATCLEIGLNQCELEQYRDAVRFLRQACKWTDAEKILADRVTPEEEEQEAIRLNMMTVAKRRVFLEQKREKHEADLAYEYEKQRQRIRTAYATLFSSLLHLQKPKAAQAAMQQFLEMATQEERVDALQDIHRHCKAYHNLIEKDHVGRHTVMHGDLGLIGNMHVTILEELHSIFPSKKDYIHWLARLRGERCDLNTSLAEFEKFFERKEPKEEDKQELAQRRQRLYLGMDERVVQQPHPPLMAQFASENQEDLDRARQRTDFTRFGGTHRSTGVMIYRAPERGWDSVLDCEQIRAKPLSVPTPSFQPTWCYNDTKELSIGTLSREPRARSLPQAGSSSSSSEQR